jgi:hypothetical protein
MVVKTKLGFPLEHTVRILFEVINAMIDIKTPKINIIDN